MPLGMVKKGSDIKNLDIVGLNHAIFEVKLLFIKGLRFFLCFKYADIRSGK